MRVLRYIALFFCLCGLVSCAYADLIPARVLIGTNEVPLAPPPVYDGVRVLAPISVLASLGATSTHADDSVAITAASGQSGAVKTVDVNGKPMLPMDKVMGIVGGEQAWNAKNRTLTLLSRLDSVEYDNDTLKVNCSFPVRASAKPWNGKLVVDVIGARVASEAKEVYIGAPAVDRARLGQLNATTARVTLDFSKSTGYELQTKDAVSQILVKIADNLTPIPPAAPQPTATPSASSTITGVAVQTVDENSFDVIISTSGRAYASADFSVSPPRIVIGMPKSKIGPCAITGAHSLVKPELIKTSSGAKLMLALARPLDYSVQTTAGAVTVHVRSLQKSGGTLSGKLIVIDPGHGGPKQKGACAGGVMEKTVNMQIAKDLAAELAKQGAKTVFSHEADVMMEQSARAQVAIDSGADFFIAIHCNSNMVPDSTSGIETYYHFQEPSPKTLACLIHDRVCKSTGMCDLNARSDSKLWSVGLGVLRTLSGSGIPGILIECGYINNSSDRAKLLDGHYRNDLTKGIVAGLKAYVEDTTVQ